MLFQTNELVGDLLCRRRVSWYGHVLRKESVESCFADDAWLRRVWRDNDLSARRGRRGTGRWQTPWLPLASSRRTRATEPAGNSPHGKNVQPCLAGITDFKRR